MISPVPTEFQPVVASIIFGARYGPAVRSSDSSIGTTRLMRASAQYRGAFLAEGVEWGFFVP